jgi:hypothetical protein
MDSEVVIGRRLRIRDTGRDEYWLQEQIVSNPGCLGLGELDVVSKERRQSIGGRLDILLKNPADDSMYEVEVMLGETDESHIIRTIEYWDNEKRRWPQRQHFAVLVAESITRRFFNVIQLLSHAVPIVAIQANLLEAHGQLMLNFVTVLDTYEEPEDETNGDHEVHDEAYWKSFAPWTLETARVLHEIVSPVFDGGTLKYLKYYIAFNTEEGNCFWLHKRSGGMSLLGFWLTPELVSEACTLLDSNRISYVNKPESIRLTLDGEMLRKNAELFRSIAAMVKQAWTT